MAYDDAQVKSYRYVRMGMVGLLLGLGVAVTYQSAQQDSILGSISAYYYTPAQAIFVGALIALGVSMIALKGTTEPEDVILNLAGMLAPVVAIVPTSRGKDYRDAVTACRDAGVSLLTERAPTRFDCPTVHALEQATDANVENNMIAVLIVGGAGLFATWLYAALDRSPAIKGRSVWIGLSVATFLYVIMIIAFIAYRSTFIDKAHYAAAILLFLFIITVVIINANRSRTNTTALAVPTLSYSVIALLLALTVLTLVPLWLSDRISLFWVEASVIGLFAVFWVVQTIDQWSSNPPLGPGPQDESPGAMEAVGS